MSHSECDVATSIEKTIYLGLHLYSVSDNWNCFSLGKNLKIVEKLELSYARLRPASQLSLLVLVNSELFKCEK